MRLQSVMKGPFAPWILAVAVGLTGVSGGWANGLGSTERELALKAGFLLNFVQLVTWPSTAFESPTAPLIIGVLEPDPFGRVLDDVVDGAVVDGRPLHVVRLKWSDDIRRCHTLFIPHQAAKDTAPLLSRLGVSPILTVGDHPQFAENGGAIALRLEDNRLRFDANQGAARKVGLNMGSRMLQLARVVSK